MEMQGLHPQTANEMSSLIAKWKVERDRIHMGMTFPIGEKPDGFSWTGFVTEALDGDGGYVLFFRECNESAAFEMDMLPYFKSSEVEILSGDGEARIKGSKLAVTVPNKLGYLWLKLR
jgi:hypothetical protein